MRVVDAVRPPANIWLHPIYHVSLVKKEERIMKKKKIKQMTKNVYELWLCSDIRYGSRNYSLTCLLAYNIIHSSVHQAPRPIIRLTVCPVSDRRTRSHIEMHKMHTKNRASTQIDLIATALNLSPKSGRNYLKQLASWICKEKRRKKEREIDRTNEILFDSWLSTF